MRRRDLFDKLTLSVDLPAEPKVGQPVVELFGCNRVIVENHSGITQYDGNEIWIKVRFGIIRIIGNHLHIARMSDQRLIICGCIDCVETRRGK